MLWMDQEAQSTLTALYQTEPHTAERIDDMLDVLERDSSDPRVRRRGIRASSASLAKLTGALWGFSVPGRDHDFLVLWQQDDADVDVRSIGPDPL